MTLVNWILEQPIINRTTEETKDVKQILSGLAKILKADRQTINIDRVMRLPGTLNVKDLNNPKKCRVIETQVDRIYSLRDFDDFRDSQYEENEQQYDYEDDLNFGKKELIVDVQNPVKALKDINTLEISEKIKQSIKTGATQKEPGKDHTRSGRDMAIITSLIVADYNYKTISSVLLNSRLGCSDRILEKGEQQLIYEVRKTLKFLAKDKPPSPQVQMILNIKTAETSSEEKQKQISKYIVSDLLTGVDSACRGYKNEARKTFYIFDKADKRLMDIEKTDFHCYLKNRYEIPKKDFDEVMDWIKSTIWDKGKEIESHTFAFFDKEKCRLYISNHANQIYKLDGSKIEIVDNGTDGVVFEFNSNYTPFNLDIKDIEGLNYFKNGFDWKRFTSGESYLYKYLIERTNFSKEELYGLSPDEQKRLLSIYFFSLFFESIQKEKPILCLIGVKDSGKTFIGTTIGQILFGEQFMPAHLSDNSRDFKISLAENYFVVFDNLDTKVNAFMDAFCVAATGGEITFRKLYTNDEEIRIRPRVFLGFTSREPQFRRDDLVDRLLLFKTTKIENRRGKSDLLEELRKNRETIMSEVLINLNSIICNLKQKRTKKLTCIFRIADFETFGRKVHDENGEKEFVSLLDKMNRVKGDFSLEDDEAYIVLSHICIENDERIEQMTANDLYIKLKGVAEEELGLKSFTRKYKNARSLGRKLANIKEELKVEFDVCMEKGRSNLVYYSFSKIEKEQEGVCE